MYEQVSHSQLNLILDQLKPAFNVGLALAVGMLAQALARRLRQGHRFGQIVTWRTSRRPALRVT